MSTLAFLDVFIAKTGGFGGLGWYLWVECLCEKLEFGGKVRRIYIAGEMRTDGRSLASFLGRWILSSVVLGLYSRDGRARDAEFNCRLQFS